MTRSKAPKRKSSLASRKARLDASPKRRSPGTGQAAASSPDSAQALRIARGAEAHYQDADYYDHTYKARRNDVRFYTEFARERGGRVLELGVGTGRVALALARAGVETLGVDPVPAMLARAREKQAQLPPDARELVSFRAGDLRSVRLKRRFELVFSPFNVFMHLYTRRDLERALQSVRVHLAPRGRFVFDVSMPDLRAMLRAPGKLYRGPRLTEPVSGRKYEYFEAFEYQAAGQVQLVSMVFQSLEQLQDLKIVPLSQRVFFPQELEALLHYNGFVLEQHWGDFSRGPLSADSESQVLVARLR